MLPWAHLDPFIQYLSPRERFNLMATVLAVMLWKILFPWIALFDKRKSLMKACGKPGTLCRSFCACQTLVKHTVCHVNALKLSLLFVDTFFKNNFKKWVWESLQEIKNDKRSDTKVIQNNRERKLLGFWVWTCLKKKSWWNFKLSSKI